MTRQRFKKVSGTVVRSRAPTGGWSRAVPATVPDTFLNHAGIGACLLVSAVLAGCGQNDVELADVKGAVHFHGLPAFAELLFEPLGPDGRTIGRPSTAYTDTEGRFEVMFSPSRSGATVGRHRITIKVFWNAGAAQPAANADPVKIAVLTREVTPGDNTFHFAIAY